MRISKKGFTLIEVMVAAAILGIGCLGVLGLMMTAIRHNNESHLRTKAIYIAEAEATRFQIEQATCANDWTQIVTDADLPDEKNDFMVFCKQFSDTTEEIGGEHPIAIRVAWGQGCTNDMVGGLDEFANARTNSQCDFVTVSYVPFNKF